MGLGEEGIAQLQKEIAKMRKEFEENPEKMKGFAALTGMLALTEKESAEIWKE